MAAVAVAETCCADTFVLYSSNLDLAGIERRVDKKMFLPLVPSFWVHNGLCKLGLFLLPSSLLTVCTTFFPWNLFTSFVIRVAFVSLGPIPTSFLAEARDTYLYHVTNKHLQSVLSHLECLLFQFGHQHGGDGSWHSTKGLQPPQGHLCLKREAERPRCPRLIHR